MTPDRGSTIACIGVSDWDRLIAISDYPEAGGFARVLEEVSAPGGPTTNTAVALSRLGARVVLTSAVGADERGQLIRRGLEAAGIDTRWITVKPEQVTTLATVTALSSSRPGRSLSGEINSTSPGSSAGMCWSSTLRTFHYDASYSICPPTPYRPRACWVPSVISPKRAFWMLSTSLCGMTSSSAMSPICSM
jgi:hypothetical protein